MNDCPQTSRGNEVALRWRALAERRLAALDELYQSGRWRRYYGEPEFLALMRDALDAVEAWRRIAPDAPNEATIAPAAGAGVLPASVRD